MPQNKIWDSPHQKMTINNWKTRGLILKEGETYKDIYYYVMSIDNCNQCSVKFNKEVHNEKRCMDHDHSSGYFRQVLCQKCNSGCDRCFQINNKSGYSWISRRKKKKGEYGKVYVYFQYRRTGFKRKSSVSLTKLFCLSFINLLKKPM